MAVTPYGLRVGSYTGRESSRPWAATSSAGPIAALVGLDLALRGLHELLPTGQVRSLKNICQALAIRVLYGICRWSDEIDGR